MKSAGKTLPHDGQRFPDEIAVRVALVGSVVSGTNVTGTVWGMSRASLTRGRPLSVPARSRPARMRLLRLEERWIVRQMADDRDEPAQRTDDDLALEAGYRAEFRARAEDEADDSDGRLDVAGRPLRIGDLRAQAIHDLAQRVSFHPLLARADDTARVAALRFVERRLGEADKIEGYAAEGSFQGFLRRVLTNLLLDWLRSPAGKAELRRAEHTGESFESAEEMILPREEHERRRRLTLHHLVAVRAIQSLPPGRGVPLRLSLWPAYEHADEDLRTIAGFSHCHESADGQADARACDAGKRCTTPPAAWCEAHARELDAAKATEPEGLSRRAIATITRIGHGKPMPKREGAICERISKGRLQLVEGLRRAGIRGAAS